MSSHQESYCSSWGQCQSKVVHLSSLVEHLLMGHKYYYWLLEAKKGNKEPQSSYFWACYDWVGNITAAAKCHHLYDRQSLLEKPWKSSFAITLYPRHNSWANFNCSFASQKTKKNKCTKTNESTVRSWALMFFMSNDNAAGAQWEVYDDCCFWLIDECPWISASCRC